MAKSDGSRIVSMQPHRRVILLVEAASAYGRGCLRGIARFARGHGGWVFYHATRYLVDPINTRELMDFGADGVIARIENTRIAAMIRRLEVPTIDIRGTIRPPGVAGVYTDDRKVIEMASNHLVSNGLKCLAYCGYPGVDFSDMRQQQFIELHNGSRVETHVFAPRLQSRRLLKSNPYERRGVEDGVALQNWLKGLPKPVGVIACNDTRGRQVLQACAAADLRVPYDVSVVGVDDDDVLCELSHPTLSSVAPNVEAIGYDAAHLLDRVLAGEALPDEPIYVPPVAIEVRGSSDVMAMTDPMLVEAVRLIRARIGDGINVKEVLSVLHVSRSTFERQFRDHLGCTPYDYILRCRIDRTKQLLVDTKHPLTVVTRMAGFRNVAHMTAVFRQRTGTTPAQYRRISA